MKKITAVLLVSVLCMTLFVPGMAAPPPASDPVFDASLADKPTGIIGRVLTPDKTGDVVDWIEIAQNGKYSLIIRKEYLTIYPNKMMYGNDVSRDYKWQYTNTYGTSDFYMLSVVRNYINRWFNGEPWSDALVGEHDKLPVNARLRAFTMQVHPQVTPGTGTTLASLENGFSRPSKYQVGVGDDIAFALSYCESANFLSRRMFVRDRTVLVGGKQVSEQEAASSDLAIANYNRMVFPNITGEAVRWGMWLRNKGDIKGTVGALDAAPQAPLQGGAGIGRVFQEYYNSTTFRGYVYPACWVDQEIFTSSARTPPAPVTIVPTGVNGRILTPEMTGDNANWIEIAKCGESSLIVRQKFLNLYPEKVMYGKVVTDDPNWQYNNGFGIDPDATNKYMESGVRMRINMWFNVSNYSDGFDYTSPGESYPTFIGEQDKLPYDARLRDYAVQATTKYYIGSSAALKSMTDGLSRPTGYQCGIGNDVAFTLSYGEAASFLSLSHFLRDRTPNQETASSAIAIANYNKLNLTNLLPSRWGMWLRSLAEASNYAPCLDFAPLQPTVGGASVGKVTQTIANRPDYTFKGFTYPALWVGQGIFGPTVTGHTVKGLVSPLVTRDVFGLGDSFMKAHEVVVELRSTFNTPAPAGLSTVAVLKDSTGLGEFTFTGVPDGDYVLWIHRPGYLTRAMKVTISGAAGSTITLAPPGTTEGGVFKLWHGDSTDDLKVDNDDILMILEMIDNGVNAFSPLYNGACDLNADGLIDFDDILMVLDHWNDTARMYPGAGDVNFYG